ncbi:MAG TPA: hypothetical protein VFW03_09750 [Gemmatimonadaceae bacterium]|nr:hypothetical protein [Gemmatimonadaceae bacterium]
MRPAARLVTLSGAALAAAMAAARPFRHPTPPPQQGTPADTGRPAITLLYQNFPNPFPSTASRTTCIWFDLDRATQVSLTIHDVRGNLVRTLLPNAASPQVLQPGRYGRGPSSGAGCDPAFTWDGTAADGSVVPRGVYLIRLRAGGVQSIKKAVFQGP